MLPGIDHDLVAFVMARRQESGGFGLAPSLPASIEDTYHAFRILEMIRPLSEKELRELKGNDRLKTFLTRQEDRETWSLGTAYRYLALCAFCGLSQDQGWLEGFLDERPKQTASLRDRYWIARIRRELSPGTAGLLQRTGPDAPPLEYVRIFEAEQPESWRTAEELWMCLYLHEGSAEALHTTKKELIGWLQSCQTPDGGFGALPETTSFIENTYRCLRALALLGGAPLHRNMARDFILRCKTRGGGFARKNGAAPFLYATWHAVAGLSLLRIPSRGPRPNPLPSAT